MDAVRAPAGLPGIPEGTIICRATIADPTYGCVPSSIMGPGAMKAAAAAWINTNAWSDRTFTDNTVAANLRGTSSEEHTPALQSLLRISYAALCMHKKTHTYHKNVTAVITHTDKTILT